MLWRTRGAVAFVILAAGIIASPSARAIVAPTDPLISLSPRMADARTRVDAAAREAIARYSEWLGDPPSQLTIGDDRTWQREPGSMNIESHVAFDLARQWFGPSADAPAVVAVAWYLQSRIVETLYDHTYQQSGHSGEVLRFFDRSVARDFATLRRSRWTAGTGRDELIGRRWPDTARVLPAAVDDDAVRSAMALASLERAIGWPALQGGLYEVRRQSSGGPVSIERLQQVLSDATGRETARVFEAYRGDTRPDFAITQVAGARCDGSPCYKTAVAVEARDGSSFQPLTIRVTFGDGQQADARWAGTQSATLEFESPAPYVSVQLDPDGVELRDRNLLNNRYLASPQSNVPAGKWAARWVVWLADAMLVYSTGL